MGFGGFSWKRALGVSKAKRKVSRATGIPTSRAGRRRKAQSTMWNALFGNPKRRK